MIDAAPPRPRNATLDIARLLAAFGIVLFHSGAAGRSIGYAALPFFLMLLIVLGLPTAAKHPFAQFAKSRAQRLLVPWVIWSAVYGALKLCEVAVTQKTTGQEFSLSMLLTGPALHLWFLPFAFVACLTLPPLSRLWPATQTGRWGMLCLILIVSLASLGLQQSTTLPVPSAQWAMALPALGLGVAFGLGRGDTALIAGTAAGVLLAGAVAYGIGWDHGLLQLGLASAALLLCLALHSRESALSRLCAQTSMTVYLVHPLVMSVLTRGTSLAEHSVALAAATMIGSFLFACGLFYTNLYWHQRVGKGMA